jgi:hypothetical protein
MQLIEHVLLHGTVFATLMTIYLLAIMRGFNPRIWAFSDYPKTITDHVPPQTDRERKIAGYLVIPFFILIFGFPIISTMMLEDIYGGSLPLLDAFLNIFALVMFGTFADYVILDYLIVGTITPEWVIIPGTEHMRDKEYKEFRGYHAKGHAKAFPVLILLSLVFAALIVFL